MKLVLAAIMCPSFCVVEEPPPLCEVEQPCDTTDSGGGTGGIPFLPMPLFLGNPTGGNSPSVPFVPLPPRMPEIPNTPPSIPPITPPVSPPENPPTQVVPEPSSAVVIATLAFTGFLLNRKKKHDSCRTH